MPNPTPFPPHEPQNSSPDTPSAVSLRSLEAPTDAGVPPGERVQVDAEPNASQAQNSSLISAPPQPPLTTSAAPPPVSPPKPESTPASSSANVASFKRPPSCPVQNTGTLSAEHTRSVVQTEAQGTPSSGNELAARPTATPTSHSTLGVPLPSTIINQRRNTSTHPTTSIIRATGSTGPELSGGRTRTPTSSLPPSSTAPTAVPTDAPTAAEPNGNFLRTQLLQQRRTQLQSRRNTFDGLITLVSFVLLIMVVRGVVVPVLNMDDAAGGAAGG